MSTPLTSWAIRAVNLAEHADNPVHTEAGGIAAGYGGAVVAGTTVYAYLSRPAAAAWGAQWVTAGGAEVRFRAPVLADELVEIEPEPTDAGWLLTASTGGGPCAVCDVVRAGFAPADPIGERLEPLVAVLGDRWAGYAQRAGEDLDLYERAQLVHPAVWPALANRVFATQLVDGAWVHTRSSIRHLGPARPGETAVVESFVVDRFDTRAGERAIVDVRISIDGRPVAAVEHEAIVRLS